MNVGVGDGGVRFVSGDIANVWYSLCDPRDGQNISTDW